jgi:hypothetical protein
MPPANFFCLFETGCHCVGQSNIEFEILLPQPLEYRDYRHERPRPAPANIPVYILQKHHLVILLVL